MDHPTGKQIYRLDQSLIERLSSSGLAMSRLDVQRRMRPEISALIRYSIFYVLHVAQLTYIARRPLYKNIQDHEDVMSYPPVRGIAHNLFFLHHSHPERGGDDAVSKYNEYEVRRFTFLLYRTDILYSRFGWQSI